LNTRNRVSANFNWDNYQTPNGYSSGSSLNNSSLSTNGAIVVHTRFLVANWSSTISNSIVNNLRFQWARDLETAGANSGGPSISVTNLISYGMPNALPRPAFPDEHRLQLSDTLSQTFGNHQLKYGVDLNFIHELLINLYEGGGLYSYSGASAFSNWALDVYGIADSTLVGGVRRQAVTGRALRRLQTRLLTLARTTSTTMTWRSLPKIAGRFVRT